MLVSGRRVVYLCVGTLIAFVLLWHAPAAYSPLRYTHLSGDASTGTRFPGGRVVTPHIWTPSTETKEQVPIEAMNSTWQRWSQIIYDCGPHGVDKILLNGNAPNTGTNDEDVDMRAPYRELVTNGPEDIEILRDQHDRFLTQLLHNSPPAAKMFAGYGIVMVGGDEYFGPAITGIQMLRRTGCELPVEVFVKNEGEYEPDVCDDYLPRLNARCVVLSTLLASQTNATVRPEATHYQLKSLALVFASFRHVLLLDSDSVPLVDPYKELMLAEPYTSTGMVVWPDFWLGSESPSFWRIAGLAAYPPKLAKQSTESGQMLVDKATHFQTLLLALYYNIHGPGLYYPLLSQGALGQGDKETWLAAAVVLKQAHYKVRTGVEAVRNEERSGQGMLQSHPGDDRDAKPLVRAAFLHANTPKLNAGHLVDEGDLAGKKAPAGRRIRLWELGDGQKERIGADAERLEEVVWGFMRGVACDLGTKLRDWRNRERVCERVGEYVDAVFPAVDGVDGVDGGAVGKVGTDAAKTGEADAEKKVDTDATKTEEESDAKKYAEGDLATMAQGNAA